jgi:hypothetical protein
MRDRLANDIGIRLCEMQGFGGNKSWDSFKDPIIPFLDHSDCEGEIDSNTCGILSKRILELVENWDDDYDKKQLVMLAKDMELLSALGEPLIFS